MQGTYTVRIKDEELNEVYTTVVNALELNQVLRLLDTAPSMKLECVRRINDFMSMGELKDLLKLSKLRNKGPKKNT